MTLIELPPASDRNASGESQACSAEEMTGRAVGRSGYVQAGSRVRANSASARNGGALRRVLAFLVGLAPLQIRTDLTIAATTVGRTTTTDDEPATISCDHRS
jgi:hypothetical protein